MKKTFWKWVWIFLQEISYLQEEVVSAKKSKKMLLPSSLPFRFLMALFFYCFTFEKCKIILANRYKGDIGNDCLLSVDCADKRMREMWPYIKKMSDILYSHKFHGPGLRYEIGIGIISGDICWVNGPFLCGKEQDYDIFSSMRGLMGELDVGERIEADDGYREGDPFFVKTRSGMSHHPRLRKMRNKVRARHETVNGRMAMWGCMSKIWHHSWTKHQTAFFAVAVITQLEIENGEPLFGIENYRDIV